MATAQTLLPGRSQVGCPTVRSAKGQLLETFGEEDQARRGAHRTSLETSRISCHQTQNTTQPFQIPPKAEHSTSTLQALRRAQWKEFFAYARGAAPPEFQRPAAGSPSGQAVLRSEVELVKYMEALHCYPVFLNDESCGRNYADNVPLGSGLKSMSACRSRKAVKEYTFGPF